MTSNIKTLLFTDKYKPKSYSDLLTEEKTNREILTWMKSWDEIVFNKKFQIPKIPITQNLTQIRSQNKKNIKTQNLKSEKKMSKRLKTTVGKIKTYITDLENFCREHQTTSFTDEDAINSATYGIRKIKRIKKITR